METELENEMESGGMYLCVLYLSPFCCSKNALQGCFF